jgi:hypothetical protein
MSTDEELKSLLRQAEELTFGEYCKTCHTPNDMCEHCHFDRQSHQPSEYLTARELIMFYSYEDEDWGDR